MRIVFMGTPGFAATILENLVQHHEVVAVFTRPDAVRSRGKKLLPSPVKQVALESGIAVYTPTSFDDGDATALLAELKPDAVCVAAYGIILPSAVLDIPPYGCLNVHASVLPQWRGAAPVERAIMAGDEITGVSIMRMEEGLDTGDYAIVRTTEVGEKNCTELTLELAELGSAALLATLAQLEQGSVAWVEQDDFFATYAHRIAKREFFLYPSDDALLAVRKVRASSPAHPSKCIVCGRTCTIVDATRVSSRLLRADLALDAGQVGVHDNRLYLGMADGLVEVGHMRPDGKRTMQGSEFALGIHDGAPLVWSGIDG